MDGVKDLALIQGLASFRCWHGLVEAFSEIIGQGRPA